MPHKSETERPLKLVDGIYIFQEPKTHVTKKNRHRHIKDGSKKKKPIFIPAKDVKSVYLETLDGPDILGGEADVPERP